MVLHKIKDMAEAYLDTTIDDAIITVLANTRKKL